MGVNFSICLTVKNEAKTLPRLLVSLREFRERGGEICVLDTGSTDTTVEVAKSFGCKVEEVGDMYLKTLTAEKASKVNQAFIVGGEEPILKEGDTFFCFNRARNHVAKMASNDMILGLDADEEVTRLDIDKIHEWIEMGFTHLDYIQVFTHDKEGNPEVEFLQCKFYDRRVYHWENNTHEMLIGDGRRGTLDKETFLLEHWQDAEKNRSGYMKGLAVDCFLHPHKDRQCQYFARELFYSGRILSAKKEFERHLKMVLPPPEYPTTPTRLDSWLFLGNIYGRMGDLKKELECYVNAMEDDPTNRRPIERMAQFYQWHGDKKKAAEYALKAAAFPWDEKYGGARAHFSDIINGIINWSLI